MAADNRLFRVLRWNGPDGREEYWDACLQRFDVVADWNPVPLARGEVERPIVWLALHGQKANGTLRAVYVLSPEQARQLLQELSEAVADMERLCEATGDAERR